MFIGMRGCPVSVVGRAVVNGYEKDIGEGCCIVPEKSMKGEYA